MDDSDVFAERLREARQRKNVSRVELGQICKNRDGDPLSRAAIAQWERPTNPTRPTFENLTEAARHLGASIDYLVGLRDIDIPLSLSTEAISIALTWDKISQSARESAMNAIYWADKVESRPTPTIDMILEKILKEKENPGG